MSESTSHLVWRIGKEIEEVATKVTAEMCVCVYMCICAHMQDCIYFVFFLRICLEGRKKHLAIPWEIFLIPLYFYVWENFFSIKNFSSMYILWW